MKAIAPLLIFLAACSSAPEKLSPSGRELLWPTSGFITQGYYGNLETSSWIPTHFYDEHNRLQFWNGLKHFHRGIDVAAAEGTPVCAAAGGVARVYKWDGESKNYGNRVVIHHGNDLYTLYAHMKEITVADRATVNPGQQIGLVGSTGNSTGPHLHFEVRHDDSDKYPFYTHYAPGAYGDRILQGQKIGFLY